jgi:pimeloyl-ACP methyl ester carboxylesterase
MITPESGISITRLAEHITEVRLMVETAPPPSGFRMAGSSPDQLLEPAERVNFYQDDGHKLEGDILLRPGVTPRVAVIFCTGWGGNRALGVNAETFATGIADRVDAVTLNFDYSGWGASEGPRNRLDPFREVADVRCAVSYMKQRYPDLAERIVLFGISFGGGIVPVAGALDARVASVIALSGYASGERFLREQRAHWQWVEFKERLERDRLQRVVSGRSELVDPDEIMVRDPEAKAYNQKLLDQYPNRRFQLDLVSAERIMEFDVAGPAGRLRGRPSLFIHAERDLLIPWQSNAAVAEAAGGRFVLLPGIGHYHVYAGAPLIQILDHIGSFLIQSDLA